jgi:hypothetical protein
MFCSIPCRSGFFPFWGLLAISRSGKRGGRGTQFAILGRKQKTSHRRQRERKERRQGKGREKKKRKKRKQRHRQACWEVGGFLSFLARPSLRRLFFSCLLSSLRFCPSTCPFPSPPPSLPPFAFLYKPAAFGNLTLQHSSFLSVCPLLPVCVFWGSLVLCRPVGVVPSRIQSFIFTLGLVASCPFTRDGCKERQ